MDDIYWVIRAPGDNSPVAIGDNQNAAWNVAIGLITRQFSWKATRANLKEKGYTAERVRLMPFVMEAL